MSMGSVVRRAAKLVRLLKEPWFRKGLRHGIGAAIEHRDLMRTLPVATVVDIGANVGQFSLLARVLHPNARIFAFEPLQRPAQRFEQLFAGDGATTLLRAAIGATEALQTMHVAGKDDSSSLLPIGPLQIAFAPVTAKAGVEEVRVAPLSTFLSADRILAPALLKIDVQGYESEVISGCADLLDRFTWIYCEASFVELYLGQPLAAQVIAQLDECGFELAAVNTLTHDKHGAPIQADFLFRRRE